jgi:hypothetical protein
VSNHESDDDARLMALGQLTVRSAKLEEDLRSTFINLVGSKYAAVVAGGQAASWLINQCQALVKANLEMSDEGKASMRAALDECKVAAERRNTLIHGLMITGKPGDPVIIQRSRRGTFEPTIESWTDEDIRVTTSRLSAARSALHDAIRDALGYEALMVEYMLRQETRERRSSTNEIPT